MTIMLGIVFIVLNASGAFNRIAPKLTDYDQETHILRQEISESLDNQTNQIAQLQ